MNKASEGMDDRPKQRLRNVVLQFVERHGSALPQSACDALVDDLVEALTSMGMLRDNSPPPVPPPPPVHALEPSLRALLDHAPLLIIRLAPATGRLLYLNRYAERLLGVPTVEALDMPLLFRAVHADVDGVDAYNGALARASAGDVSLPYQACLTRRDGARLMVHGTLYPVRADDGRVTAVEGVFADVSREHATRNHLLAFDRWSTLGMLTGGLIHELNNPAAFIMLGLDLLDRSIAGSSMDPQAAVSMGSLVSELRESIGRMTGITRDLQVFASPPPLDRSRWVLLDVNRTVDAAIGLARGRLLEHAQIDRQLQEVPPVRMEGGRLGQVVVNLLLSALQSIQNAGAGSHRIEVSTWSDGRTVVLSVSDTGAGMRPEDLPRIGPSFATARRGSLGLSLGCEIVERAGGVLTFERPVPESSPPRGARSVLRLPVAEVDRLGEDGQPPMRVTAPCGGRVLIVDEDEAMACALAEAIGCQHRVEVVSGAAAALERLTEGWFDVVLCDLRMPSNAVEALYARVRIRRAEQAGVFIFMTGVALGTEVERWLAGTGRPVLEKPFSAAEALAAITRELRRRLML